MKIFKALLLLPLLLAAGLTFAASTTNTISWTNATTYTDGSPFTSLCCVNVYKANNAAGTGGVFLAQTKGAITTYADIVTTAGTFCYSLQTVSSKTGDTPSTVTPYVCKTVTATTTPPASTKANPPSAETVK